MSSKVNHAKRSHRSEARHYRAAVNRKIGAASKLRPQTRGFFSLFAQNFLSKHKKVEQKGEDK